MKVPYAIMVIAAFAVMAEGAPQGFWDRVTGSVSDAWDATKDTAGNAWDFTKGAAQGTGDMVNAYGDMREANWKNSDQYFHSRGNHDAAQRGPGGEWAAGVISDAREWSDQLFGDSPESSARDQEANHWGRNGGDPNRYRPPGLPKEY